jgi:Concanavalin A-like lectin/glucanases superfamily/Putative Ig domain
MPKYLLAVILSLCLLIPTLSWGQAGCTHFGAPSAQGNGSGSSLSNAMTVANFIAQSSAGQVLCLADGTYTGTGIQFFSDHQGSPGSPITIRAINDGGPFFDGGFGSNVIYFQNTSYITVQGVDGCCSPQFNNPLSFTDSHHITIQRVCVWHSNKPQFAGGQGSNQHVIGFGSHDLLLEDICAFGYGRNTLIMAGDNTFNNVMRRAWARWDGWEDNNGGTCPGGTIQTQYGTSHTNDIYENTISIFWGGLYGGAHPDGFPCGSLGAGWGTRAGIVGSPADGGSTPGASWLGFINYGYPDHNDIITNKPFSVAVGMSNRWGQITIQDVYSDGRFGPLNAYNINLYGCDLPDLVDPINGGGRAGPCSQVHIHNLTSILSPGQQTGTLAPAGSDSSNLAECTDPGSCPNFYTGAGGGSRACFEYQNGSLTNTPLWPWRMDDRIKQALQRSGIGQGLAGGSGPGFNAGTVTSEIVSRYGSVPSQCLRGGGPVLNPPVITSATTASGTVGVAFNYQITATNSPTSYSATGLPGGLTINTSTGLISGAPNAAGTSSITLGATNNDGTGNATLTLTVTGPTTPARIWLTFEECTGTTLTDLQKNGNTASLQTAPTLPTFELGRLGKCGLHFHGTEDTVQVNMPALGSNFTIALGLKADDAIDGTQTTIPFYAPYSTGDAVTFYWNQTNVNFRQSFAMVSNGTFSLCKYVSSLSASTWYRLLMTYDGTTLRCYLNGVLEASVATGMPQGGMSGMWLAPASGVTGGPASFDWRGMLEEVLVDDHAYTQTEITSDFNRVMNPPPEGPLGR